MNFISFIFGDRNLAMTPTSLEQFQQRPFLPAAVRLFNSTTWSDPQILNHSKHTSLQSVTFCTPQRTLAYLCSYNTC